MSYTPTPRPRLIIEQEPDGTLVIENYINGARSRQTLNRGFEMLEIKAALQVQSRSLAAQAARSAAAQLDAERKRHTRILKISASTPGQGIAFAQRVIGGNANPAAQPARSLRPTTKPIPNVKDLF